MQLDLPFFAPIPVGHEVTVYATETKGLLGGWDEGSVLVLDEVTRIVWASVGAPDNIHAAEMDLERHSKGGLRHSQVKPPFRARVVGCLVRSKGEGKYNYMHTQLTLAPVNQPAYR